MESNLRSINIFLITIMLLLGGSLFWLNTSTRNEINSLNQKIDTLTVNKDGEIDNQFDPPTGEAETGNWSIITNTQYNFSIKHPTSWVTNVNNDSVIPKRNIEISSNNSPLTLTVSSNLEPSTSWRQITLSSGETAYYEFAEGFDHYYLPNGESMLIWSVPARSYDGLYTEQELQEAIQIINTYRKL